MNLTEYIKAVIDATPKEIKTINFDLRIERNRKTQELTVIEAPQLSSLSFDCCPRIIFTIERDE